MARYKQIDLSKARTISISQRRSKVALRDFGKPYDPVNESFGNFIDSLPDTLAAKNLRALADSIVAARRKKKPVILMMGAHLIKVGLSPLVIDLLRQGIITAIAMNSAASIHDVETALWGKTSEDVAANLIDGSFGMSKETGEFINNTLSLAYFQSDEGYGETLGKALVKAKARFSSESILASCHRLNIPITVHAAIGTDIIHQQPTMDGAATGELSFRDFKVLAEVIRGLGGGGVVLNFGSAVIMPEVFLKALTVARNIGAGARGFVTANFDMLRHYRPSMNVVSRPTQADGTGYDFSGHHEIMLPLLAAMIKQRIHARRKHS